MATTVLINVDLQFDIEVNPNILDQDTIAEKAANQILRDMVKTARDKGYMVTYDTREIFVS